MKNFKKLMALVIAGAMVLGTVNFAFADDPEPATIVPEGLTADTTVTIGGLDAGDVVTLYKIIEWKNNAENTSAGWVLTDTFKDNTAAQAVLAKINGKKDEGPYTLTKEDVKAFTDVINNLTDAQKTAAAIAGAAVDGGSSVNTVEPGSYLALVKPAVAGTLYNPIIVSADYFDNATDEIIASSGALVGGAEGFAKKETLKVEKEEDDKTDDTDESYDVGDTVSFTVKTTIPTFAEAYVNPAFTVTDEMSDGLVITDGTIKVYEEDGTTEIATLTAAAVKNSTKKWTLDVPSNYITALEAPKPIVIKYDAVLTETAFTSVTEEVNDVKVEFSNNPNNNEDKGTVKDRTRTYTFSIDGTLLGGGGEATSELVKVAVDGNGDPIFQSTSTNSTYQHALAGATFALFTDSTKAASYTGKKEDIEALDAAGKETAGIYTNANFPGYVVTDTKGFMKIEGLDEGTYYLKELTAPAGFIKDQEVHTIAITTVYGTETVTENGYTFDLPVLESYTITIDGTDTSTYSMKLEESKIKTSEIIEASNSLLKNTKGIELPSTGGMGTTLFYAIGAILVLGAGILLVSKRRMSAN